MDEFFKEAVRQVPVLAVCVVAGYLVLKLFKSWLETKDERHDNTIKTIVREGRDDMKTITSDYKEHTKQNTETLSGLSVNVNDLRRDLQQGRAEAGGAED